MPKKLTDLPGDITEHEIGEYLDDKDKSTLAVVSKTTQGLFQPARHQTMANKLLLQVIRGEQDKAEKILKIRPELLLMTGTATDYSGRTFATTAFRAALWALDTRYMCNMMLDCLPDSPQGVDIRQCLLTQFNEQLQDGLDYTLNGRTIHEVHYDFSPIKAALQTYVDNCPNWEADENWDAMTDQWCKVVGLAQRYFPANVAQHYCDHAESFDPTPAFNKKTFVRSLVFFYYVSDRHEFWFAPTTRCARDRLGADFGICRGDRRKGAGAWARAVACGPGVRLARLDLAALTALCEVRTADLVPLMKRLEGPIQKPDADRQCVIS